MHVWVSETRPRNQGAALTAWELGERGVPLTVIADNAAGPLLQRGLVDLVIVGADRVDTIRTEILRIADRFGIRDVNHWTGRNTSESRRNISQRTALVVFVCDRANHMMMKNVRRQAESMGIPMVFCRHSATEVRERLDDLACNRCPKHRQASLLRTQ